MKKRRKQTAIMVSAAILVSTVQIPLWQPEVSAEAYQITQKLYKNTFDSGKTGLQLPSAEGNMCDNDFLTLDGVDVAKLSDINEVYSDGENTDKAIRIRQSSWTSKKTFLFDFTKSGVRSGVRSGKVNISFDFALDSASTANDVRIGMNMTGSGTDANSGGSMMYISNTNTSNAGKDGYAPVYKYMIANSVGAWPKLGTRGELAADTPYKLEIAMDFEENTIKYYLNGTAIQNSSGVDVSQDLTGKIMNNFMIALSGIFSYIDNIEITRTLEYPLECTIDSDTKGEHFGNVFYNDEDVVLNLNVRNEDNENEYKDEQITITAKDESGKAADTKTISVSVGKLETKDVPILLDLPKYGTYTIEVSSENSAPTTAKAARSIKTSADNPKVNICAHLDGRHNGLDIPKAFDFMDNAGFGMVRTDMGWKWSEADGKYTHDAAATYYGVVEESRRTGVDILALMSTSDGPYGEDNDGGFNTTDEFLSGYYDYCKAIAENYGDTIKNYEIGNEDNFQKHIKTDESEKLVFTDKDGDGVKDDNEAYEYVYDTGADYAPMLKQAKAAIEDVLGEDAVILNSGSSITESNKSNEYDFAVSLLDTIEADGGTDNYLDRFAIHSYHNYMAPEIRDRWKSYTTWVQQEEWAKENVLNNYDDVKAMKTWATETGFFVKDNVYGKNITEQMAAQWTVRELVLNEMYDLHEKLFLYNMFNHGYDTADEEDNFGMLNSWYNEEWQTRSAYAAKPQYLAVAQWNRLLSNAELDEIVTNKYTEGAYNANVITKDPKGEYNVRFKTANGDYVNVIWAINNSSVSMTIDNKYNKRVATVYDLYGNVIEQQYDVESLTYTATDSPVYIEFSDNLYATIGNAKVSSTVGYEGEDIIFNAEVSSSGGILILAEFENDGRLKSACTMPLDGGKAQITKTVAENTKYKLMLWDSGNGMKPLCKPLKLNY